MPNPLTKTELKPVIKNAKWKGMAEALCDAAVAGIWIQPNTKHKTKERGPTPSCIGNGNHPTLIFRGIHIPTRPSHDLWGADFDKLRALTPLLNAPVIPPEIQNLADRTCKRGKTTYHHPGCTAQHKAGMTNDTTLGDIIKDTQKTLNRAKCSHCKDKWGDVDDIMNRYVWVMMCTDGSTYPNQPSAAAMVYMDDGCRKRELWDNAAYGWQLEVENNYIAELAAIHRSIRSVPVNVRLQIHTDSSSSIDSIMSALRNPERTNFLRKGGRPYIMAICRAWVAREQAGGKTELCHVRAHTGERSTAAIGNAVADRWAKWYALAKPEGKDIKSCFNMMAGELPYILWTRVTEGKEKKAPKWDEGKAEAIHGDVRKACKKHLLLAREAEWALRGKRGELIREHPTQVQSAIRRIGQANRDQQERSCSSAA